MTRSPFPLRRRPHNVVTFDNKVAAWPDFYELWAYRDLVLLLAGRDIKLRYRQTLIGGAWALLQPLMLALAFSLPLSRQGGISPAGVPYFLFALIGLIPWLYFSATVFRCSESILAHGDMLRKVYLPRILIPVAAVVPAAVDTLVTGALILPILAWLGFIDAWRLFLLIPIAVWSVALALSLGLWLATLNVLYRDVRHVTPFMLQFLMFASPVFYSTEAIPSSFSQLYQINPLVGLIESLRYVLLGAQVPQYAVGYSLAITFVLLCTGAWVFCRMESLFADVV